MTSPLKSMWQTTIGAAADFGAIADVYEYQGSAAMAYYLSLPTSQYKTKPKFMAFLQLLLTPFNDCATLACNMFRYFDIDLAIGPQLDLIGQIVGQSRTVDFNPTNGSSPTLQDGDYRVLLKATIIKNTWDGTKQSLYTAWTNLFTDGFISIVDNQDMTMTINLSGNFSSVIQDLITNGYIVPRPAGVLITNQTVAALGTLPVFGYGVESSYIAGYGTGKWAAV